MHRNLRSFFICILSFCFLITSNSAFSDSHSNSRDDDDRTSLRLKQAIAGYHRSEKKAGRDKYRNPYETLMFFGLKEDMTVLEIYPYGSWYTEIIAPVLAGTGKYYGAVPDPNMSDRAKRGFASFSDYLAKNKGLYGNAEAVPIGSDVREPIAPGTADLVLTFRNIHNWMARGAGNAEEMFEIWFNAAKPGGKLGIVEHRGNPDIEQDPKAVSGYVNEDYTIKMAEAAGWVLTAASDINNNPKDDKNYEDRVWRLPPTLTYFGREGRPKLEGEDLKRSLDIGESDRYTLLFTKPNS